MISILLLVFILSVLAAGSVAYLLWRDTEGAVSTIFTGGPTAQTEPAASATPPTGPPGNFLVPDFAVDPVLQDDYNELTQQLLIPLRAYYATKQERLGRITVDPAEDTDHTAQVSFELIDAQGPTTHTFFYDRGGTEKTGPYPTWEPSFLDITK